MAVDVCLVCCRVGKSPQWCYKGEVSGGRTPDGRFREYIDVIASPGMSDCLPRWCG